MLHTCRLIFLSFLMCSIQNPAMPAATSATGRSEDILSFSYLLFSAELQCHCKKFYPKILMSEARNGKRVIKNTTSVFFHFAQCEQWQSNAASIQSHFKSRVDNETRSFTYKLAFHRLITAIVLNQRRRMVMPRSRQLTPVLSHPVYPSIPGESLPSLADILFTVWSSAAALEWRFDFPQWHLITVAELQLHSPGVSHGQSQRQRAAPFSFIHLLGSLI